MDILHHCEYLIEIIDNSIVQKELEKEQINVIGLDETTKNVKLTQIQVEIDELKMQRKYYNDYYADEMIRKCVNGCCQDCCMSCTRR